ncbi:MAG: UpxY family transcription antiterminator [Bacteroidetes bacterium]|nr:UpxY family transcription antiterminator [Bacteroidota bacterium]
MQKNWYVIYTRQQAEKKVAATLAKKKIEHFIPMVYVDNNKSWRNKPSFKPLFKSYVFVNVTEQQAYSLLQIDGVINILHWLGKPAVINETEINAIREFTGDYQDIDLEKLQVNSPVAERNIYRSSYEMEGNIIAVKNKTIKINLPSLGYALIAKLKEESVFGKERALLQNYTFAQS